MLMQEPERRPEPEAIDEFNDRMKLFQAIFQRRAGEDNRILRAQAFHGLRGASFPVLDPLRFVQHDQIESGALDLRQNPAPTDRNS